MQDIPDTTRYRLGKDGRLYVPSKWIKRTKVVIAAAIITVGGLSVQENTSAMDWHLTRLERTTPTHVQKVLNVSEYVQRMNPTLKQDEARHIVKATFKWAGEFNLDPALILSIQAVESRFKQHAVSSAGALGLMQFIPSWHLNKVKAMTEEKKLANPDVFDPESNIFMGSWIMKDCMNVQKNVSKALLCYNGSLKSPNGYDEKVLTIYNQLKQQYRI